MVWPGFPIAFPSLKWPFGQSVDEHRQRRSKPTLACRFRRRRADPRGRRGSARVPEIPVFRLLSFWATWPKFNPKNDFYQWGVILAIFGPFLPYLAVLDISANFVKFGQFLQFCQVWPIVAILSSLASFCNFVGFDQFLQFCRVCQFLVSFVKLASFSILSSLPLSLDLYF